MKNEVIFSDLNALANKKDRISADFCKDKWTSKSYTTGAYSGQMLLTMESGYPGELSFDLNLQGRYKILSACPECGPTIICM